MLAGGSGVAVAIPRFPILIVNAPDVPDAAVESVALIVNGADSPTVAGIPVIVTEFVVLALSESFAGSAPEAMVHAKGAMPPATFTVALYVPFTVPDGSTVVVICGAPSTVNVRDIDCVGNDTDVAFTVSLTD